MLDNHSAARLCCNRKKLLFLSVIFTFSAQAYANSELKPIEVPSDHTRDNVLTRWLKPAYPVAALKNEITGMVTIEFDPNKYGNLTNVHITESKPPGIFDEAVLKTLTSWTFVPFRVYKCFTSFPRTRISINFNIENGEPRVIASKPFPLSDPATGSAGGMADDSTTKLRANADEDAVKKPELRWKVTVKPAYPLRSRDREAIYGDVVALLTVQPDGSVGETKILFSAPHAAFGEEATHTFKSWQAETVLGQLPGVTKTLCQPLTFRPANL